MLSQVLVNAGTVAVRLLAAPTEPVVTAKWMVDPDTLRSADGLRREGRCSACGMPLKLCSRQPIHRIEAVAAPYRLRLSDGKEMRLMSLFAPFSAKPSALHRLVASGAGATIVLVSAIGPAAAVEEPDITRTVEAIVHNITVDEPGDTDGELEISTVVEVDGELYDLSEVAVPPLETGDVDELGVRVALVVPTSGCTSVEYGDYADVMGIAMTNRTTGSLNTALADQLGLARFTGIGGLATGTVAMDLAPLGSVDAQRALSMAVAGGELYVDYRPAVGRDGRWPTWAGVQVHLLLIDDRGIPNSYLLNMQPSAGEFVNASMAVGRSWAVPGTRVSIKVLSAGSTARVSVTSGSVSSPSPGTSLITSYITRVYSDLFSRAVDPSGMATWSTALLRGTPRIAVANSITYSAEYRSRLIADSYRTYLNRSPDSGGLAHWLQMMDQGMTIQQMEAGFLASAEYYLRAGSTSSRWVQRLYLHVLGRSAGASEVNYWVQKLNSGWTKEGVAMGFLISTEQLTAVVDGYYVDLLGRHIDPSGRTTWVGKIQAGDRVEAIIGGIIASAEYYGRR